MKSLLIAIALFASVDALHAQGLSAGLRAGAAYSYGSDGQYGYHLRTMKGDHMSFMPEAFVRYHTKGKWAFEAAVQTSEWQNQYVTSWEHETTKVSERARNYGATLSAQYDLSCAGMRSCPVLKPLHSYFGVTLGLVRMQYESQYTGDHIPGGPVVLRNNALQVWTGLSHTMTYDLCRRMMLISTAHLSVRPVALLEHGITAYHDNPVARFGGSFGVGYRF